MAFCEQRNLLVEAYATTTMAFSDVVATLRASAEGFDEILKATEEASP
jgi:hypothetical protein